MRLCVLERDELTVEHEPGRQLGELWSSAVMFQPRLLTTRRPSTVEAVARKPSHLTS